MSDQALRSSLIRLAHANPELRPHLLPLLKEAGCEKLPEGGMRDNCEEKKAEGEENKKKASLKTASHSANEIGPGLISLVGTNLGIGRDWYKGSYYEAIGNEILDFIHQSGPQDMLLRALKPVIDKLLANNKEALKAYD